MAGDWIKMRSDLFTHPKIVRISSALKADTLRTVGGLMSVWCLFDAHSVDGKLEGYTSSAIDDHLRWSGFSAAMIAVDWMIETEEGLELPRFESHNGQSAKRRAQDADRKKEVRKMSAPEADKKRTREEKRREEKIEKPTRGSRLQTDFVLTPEWGNEALEIRADWCNQDVIEEFDGFKDYWIAAAGSKGVKADWLATWRNWCRRSNRKGTK